MEIGSGRTYIFSLSPFVFLVTLLLIVSDLSLTQTSAIDLRPSIFDVRLSTLHSTRIYRCVSDHFDAHSYTRTRTSTRCIRVVPRTPFPFIVHISQRATPFSKIVNSWVTLRLFMFNMIIGQSLFFFRLVPTYKPPSVHRNYSLFHNSQLTNERNKNSLPFEIRNS